MSRLSKVEAYVGGTGNLLTVVVDQEVVYKRRRVVIARHLNPQVAIEDLLYKWHLVMGWQSTPTQ